MRRRRFSIPVVIALLAAGSLFVGAPTPAGAAEYGPFTLTDISQRASWSGQLEASPSVPPQACVPDVCDIVTVKVELPEDTWDPVVRPGGMLVSTKPPDNYTNTNVFDLFVYGPGDEPAEDEPVAKSDGGWGAGEQAAWVKNPPNGLYTIVIAPDLLFDPPAQYDGLVSFDRGLTVKRKELNNGMDYERTFVAFGMASPPPQPVELKPDLVPTTPDNFHIETGTCLGTYSCLPKPAQQSSCYAEETAGQTSHKVPPEPGPQKCLRFDQGEYNFGDGPFELHFYPSQGNVVYQRVYKSDGSISQQPAVGDAVFHANHGHFHYSSGAGGWWDIKLHKRLPNGALGDVEHRAKFQDKGICVGDLVLGRFGQQGVSPQSYANDDAAGPCTNPSHQDPNDLTFPGSRFIASGISVGWADVYPWYVRDQYIDITNVPDGKYVIVTKQDPDGRLVENSTANNEARACVEISGNGTVARACDPQPDLQVTSLVASNTKGVREGEKVTITATVTNTGDGDAAASSTEILLDGSRLPGGLLSTPALSPGESATLSLNWDTRGVRGEHRLTATADSGRIIEESMEDNNAREITVVVRGNKIRNPSFEESSNGSSPDAWSSSGQTGYETGGSDGLRSVSTEPGGSWTSEPVPIEAGASYEASVAAAGAGGTLLVQQLAADGSVLSTAAQPLLPTGTFTLTSLHLTALTGAAKARIVLLGGLAGTTTFDDVGLFRG